MKKRKTSMLEDPLLKFREFEGKLSLISSSEVYISVEKLIFTDKKVHNKFYHICKQLRGFTRIDHDLAILINALECIQKKELIEHTHFDDYHIIAILYRKCFSHADKRGTPLVEKWIPEEKRNLHEKLLKIAKQHVAHAELEDFDRTHIYLVIDKQSNIASRIETHQFLHEPIYCTEFPDILELLRVLRNNGIQYINNLQKHIVILYNDNRAVSSI